MLDRCRVCRSSNLLERVDLGVQTFTGIFPKTREELVPEGHLRLVECAKCGLVQLDRHFDLDVLYGQTYGYRSGLNESMIRHLQQKASDLHFLVEPSDSEIILDIGASDGTLLAAFPRGKKIGFDPQAKRYAEFYPAGAIGISKFFSAKEFLTQTNGLKAKIITSIAMFYDLTDPLAFAQDIVQCLEVDGVWHTEQAYLPATLAATAFDTICHEHTEFYGLRQIKIIARMANLKIVDFGFNTINGGSFFVTMARWDSKYKAVKGLERALEQERSAINDLAWASFRTRLQSAKADVNWFLSNKVREGKRIFGLGASTKGNVLLQYFGIDNRLLAGISDVNDNKWGSFTPNRNSSLRIPIMSEQEAREQKPDYFLVLPWHFRDGIIAREAEFLKNGGGLIFPLPRFEIVTAQGTEALKAGQLTQGAK